MHHESPETVKRYQRAAIAVAAVATGMALWPKDETAKAVPDVKPDPLGSLVMPAREKQTIVIQLDVRQENASDFADFRVPPADRATFFVYQQKENAKHLSEAELTARIYKDSYPNLTEVGVENLTRASSAINSLRQKLGLKGCFVITPRAFGIHSPAFKEKIPTLDLLCDLSHTIYKREAASGGEDLTSMSLYIHAGDSVRESVKSNFGSTFTPEVCSMVIKLAAAMLETDPDRPVGKYIKNTYGDNDTAIQFSACPQITALSRLKKFSPEQQKIIGEVLGSESPETILAVLCCDALQAKNRPDLPSLLKAFLPH